MAEMTTTKRKHPEEDEEKSNKKIKYTENKAGVLLFAGLSDYDERNDQQVTKSESIKWSPHRFEVLDGIRFREVSSGPVSYSFLAITDEGKVYAWGFNQKGQLGLDDYKNHRNPTLIESLTGHNIVAVATGRQHSLLLTDEGVVFSCGDNRNGQCGIGLKKETVGKPVPIDYSGAPVVKIACGAEFSLILNEDGEVFSFGLPEYGQLGHGTENKEISGQKENFHCEFSPLIVSAFIEKDDGETISHGQPKIADIVCGVNHSCAIDVDQRMFTWGFGGYGRLGHNDTKDEYRPRLMRCWFRITGRADGGITKVFCGAQFNMVQTIVPKCTLMFGQFRRSQEANMYPKFVEDLQGWNVRNIVCNQHGYIACADDSVIAAQPSPCYGTLAMGTTVKSSANPKLITTLKDIYCHRAGLGYMHAVYIVRDESEKDEKGIDKFPTMKFDDSITKPVVVPAEEKKGKVKKKRGSKR